MKAARISDVRPEYVFLGLLAEGPVHGYELYRRFRETFGSLWHISESQMYATLKRLEERGWTTQETPAGSGAARRIVTMTEAGRTAYSQWLSMPTAASPRALRLEFLTRLQFASRSLDVAPLIAAQRAVLEAELQGQPPPAAGTDADKTDAARIGAASIGAVKLGALAADFRLRQVRAALEWLDTLNFS